MPTNLQDLKEVLHFAVLRVYARHDALEVREALRYRCELLLERRMVKEVLYGIEPGVDVCDLSQRHAQPDTEQALAYVDHMSHRVDAKGAD